MMLAQQKIESIVGPLFLVASEQALTGVFWQEPIIATTKSSRAQETILRNTIKQLNEYFLGKRKEFDLPLDPLGTDFQQRVWARLKKIPYGQTRSYKEIALELKNGNASRAVGNANGQNPISIIIPCHRVIQSDGSLGGYGGGLRQKTILLNLEKSN